MKETESLIREKIEYYKRQVKVGQDLLKVYLQVEYEARRRRNLEVETDRKDLERARKALEALRRSSLDD